MERLRSEQWAGSDRICSNYKFNITYKVEKEKKKEKEENANENSFSAEI